jgi:hypothetical protein
VSSVSDRRVEFKWTIEDLKEIFQLQERIVSNCFSVKSVWPYSESFQLGLCSTKVPNGGMSLECYLCKTSKGSVDAQIEIKTLWPKMNAIINDGQPFKIDKGKMIQIFRTVESDPCPEKMTIVVNLTIRRVITK